MVSMRDIRRRIRSVKNTQQITRAMKMVATSKLRKAQHNAETNRAFTRAVREAIEEIAGHRLNSRFWRPNNEGKRCYIVVAADKGLCGPYNSNILRHFLEVKPEKDSVNVIIGRRLRGQLQFRGVPFDYFEEIGELPTPEQAERIASNVLQRFLQGEVKEVVLIYTRFVNVLVRRITETKLLPLDDLQVQKARQDILWEPSEEEVLEKLIRHYLTSLIYNGLLEGKASELSARMVSMDAATDNAEKMIRKLTLQYNRARQASITREIAEIVGGAEALR